MQFITYLFKGTLTSEKKDIMNNHEKIKEKGYTQGLREKDISFKDKIMI